MGVEFFVEMFYGSPYGRTVTQMERWNDKR